MSTVSWNWDESALDDLLEGPEMEEFLLAIGEEIARRAADLAPKLTGAGAASIHAEVETDETGHLHIAISWGDMYFYMSFAETGTEHESPRPFLRPALDGFQI